MNFIKITKILYLSGICLFILTPLATFAQKGILDETEKLKALYEKKQFFALRNAVENTYEKTEPRLLFFRGVAAGAFFKPRVAAVFLRQYIAKTTRDDDLLIDAYGWLADSYVKLDEYGNAADACRS